MMLYLCAINAIVAYRVKQQDASYEEMVGPALLFVMIFVSMMEKDFKDGVPIDAFIAKIETTLTNKDDSLGKLTPEHFQNRFELLIMLLQEVMQQPEALLCQVMTLKSQPTEQLEAKGRSLHTRAAQELRQDFCCIL